MLYAIETMQQAVKLLLQFSVTDHKPLISADNRHGCCARRVQRTNRDVTFRIRRFEHLSGIFGIV